MTVLAISAMLIIPGTCANLAARQSSRPPAVSQPPGQQETETIETLAVVNGQPISRQQVAQESMRRFGEDVLESIINKQLIYTECQQRGIAITEKDVNDEIVSQARSFGMSDEAYIKLITTKRNIPVNRYKNDIIWSQLALQKLAATELQVGQAEIQERFEFEFGSRVQVREIVSDSLENAQAVLQQAQGNPQDFARLAKEYSINPNSASMGGLLPPVRRNSGLPEFERIAFALKPGQVSEIFEIEGRFLILQCERIEPAIELAPEQVGEANDRIVDQIRNDKLAVAGTALFKRLQETVRITNVLNDPQLSQQMPGIAAMVDETKISKRYLAEECIARFGTQMLDTEINRTILIQALREKNMQVTQDDLNAEISRAAAAHFGHDKFEIDNWLKLVTQGDESKIDFYIEDEVWPSVALRKLVEADVSVEPDDLKKGFEANFGPRVEALAIVLSDNRQALKVWDMAKNNLTKDFFGKLANQYSVEPLSKNNFGQVPPIQMHGGRPQLEQEAFNLQQGELSRIIQAGEHWIILYCMGRTNPRVTDFEAVKEELRRNIFEKKLEIAMGDEFERLRSGSQIDNFLAGTSQAGKSHTRAAASQNAAPRR